MDSIRSAKNHNHLVEEIRKKAVALNKKNWKIEFTSVKAHAEIYGNKIADRLAEEATQNYYVTYSRIPKSAIKKGKPERKHKKKEKKKKKKNERSDY
jgi:ribonuclease HI